MKIELPELPLRKRRDGDVIPAEDAGPRSQPGWIPIDPEKAKALVAESAGKEDSRPSYNSPPGTPSGLRSLSSSRRTWLRSAARSMSCRLTVILFWTNLFTTFDFDLCAAYYTTDIIDPDELASFAVLSEGGSGALGSQYSNPEVDKLILSAQTETDPQKRQDLYNQIQAMHLDHAPFIFLYYPGGSAVSNAHIKLQNPAHRQLPPMGGLARRRLMSRCASLGHSESWRGTSASIKGWSSRPFVPRDDTPVALARAKMAWTIRSGEWHMAERSGPTSLFSPLHGPRANAADHFDNQGKNGRHGHE